MAATDVVSGPVAASPEEVSQIRLLSDALSGDAAREVRYFLSDSTGRKLELPRSVFLVLAAVAREMALGHSVAILHCDHELTTQQAAEILNVSRPFLIRLLEEGKIPFHMVGTHRRIRMSDLLEYKKRRDSMRRETLKELQRVSEALGLYHQDSTE